ncbi:hypothetical protein OIE69_04015 [Actinacidiphila glaucinigra]|uniref:hypothetical protein n=1 Tax=Actinacidiphila glaucinigra TaxID=235986 RepID=UPI002DDB87CF|nr:hypothetical protein [Actinacidiphila glaucinigra]WSD58118.1 hypothetical protein OIE69_04015 [Actinacidiphila glaucinigra]
MSAREERDALTLPPALYDRALHLLRESPDGLPPRRGHSLPGKAESAGPHLTRDEVRAAVRAALDPLPDDSPTLHHRFARLGVRDSHRHLIRSAVEELPLPEEERDTARALARQLTRTGTTAPAVTAGIALLIRVGESEDVPHLAALGVFRQLTGLAVNALDGLDRRSAAVVHLATFADDELRPLVRALRTGDEHAVLAEVTALPNPLHRVGARDARRIAEAAGLPELLERHPRDTALLAQAVSLLVRMGLSYDDPSHLLAYREALALYERVVTRAGLLPPSLDHHATLLSLALDMSSGSAALLDWPGDRRAALLDTLGRLLAEPRWASQTEIPESTAEQRRRAGWIRRTGRRPFTLPATAGRLRIEVVAGDPVDRDRVETRILVDGRPVVPALFSRGPANSPELLLEEGRLRAGPEPREVQLAEAGCTEGCCGALHVTIRRDGDQVVWSNWRRALPGSEEPAPQPAPYRFDAAAYDAEVARAETDRGWSWRVRTVARLIKAGLVAEPDLLSRWDASRGWISSSFDDRADTTVVTFWYVPGLASGNPDRPDSPLQFRWDIADDGTPPEAQAAAALLRLAGEDPKTYARVSGGTRERARELGYPWPDTW